MKSLITNIVSVTLVLVLLVSMSGINVYSLYCKDSGYEKSSLFAGLEDCGNKDKVNNSYETTSHNCCSKSIESKPQKKNNECCDTSEQQYKLSIEFQIANQNVNIASIFDFVFEELNIQSKDDISFDVTYSKTKNIFKPPVAKFLLLLLHQMKTEPNPNC